MNIIKPKILKGFRDFLPEEAKKRREILAQFEEVFTQHGYSPIETPMLEYTEILLGKGSDETDKQLFRFETAGGKDVALRFDLTVPLARFTSQHERDLPKPFRRYQIAPVFRGENPQRGRYREFIQCDFDVLGSYNQNADAEILSLIYKCFKAIEVPVQISVNDRTILSDLLNRNCPNSDHVLVLRAIDKLKKLGKDKVSAELMDKCGLSSNQTSDLFDELEANELPLKEKQELAPIVEELSNHNVDIESFRFDLSLARGLDYYTGTVFETTLASDPDIGSVCSGGRYDNLTSLYSKSVIPGVGASIGVDRLLSSLESEEKITKDLIYAISAGDTDSRALVLKIADQLRAKGYKVATSLEDAKLSNHLKKANKQNSRYAIIVGDDEVNEQFVTLKDMESGEQSRLPLSDIDNLSLSI